MSEKNEKLRYKLSDKEQLMKLMIDYYRGEIALRDSKAEDISFEEIKQNEQNLRLSQLDNKKLYEDLIKILKKLFDSNHPYFKQNKLYILDNLFIKEYFLNKGIIFDDIILNIKNKLKIDKLNNKINICIEDWKKIKDKQEFDKNILDLIEVIKEDNHRSVTVNNVKSYCMKLGIEIKSNGELYTIAINKILYNPNHSTMFKSKREFLTKTMRNEIKRKYNYQCALCNGTSSLDIHHKDGNSSNIKEDNLIVLCTSCHRHFTWGRKKS